MSVIYLPFGKGWIEEPSPQPWQLTLAAGDHYVIDAGDGQSVYGTIEPMTAEELKDMPKYRNVTEHFSWQDDGEFRMARLIEFSRSFTVSEWALAETQGWPATLQPAR